MTALLLSFLGFGKSLLSGVVEWLSRRSMAELACIALALVCAFLIVANRAEKRHSAKLETQLVKCTQGREADRTAYVKAQAQAAVQNKAHVTAVEAQQQRITIDVEARYQSDLARLRANGVRPANAAPQHNPERPALPAPGSPASGPPGEVVSLPPAELLRAQELELQLNALIDWNLQQSKVDPNK